jgi:hypothetical protein
VDDPILRILVLILSLKILSLVIFEFFNPNEAILKFRDNLDLEDLIFRNVFGLQEFFENLTDIGLKLNFREICGQILEHNGMFRDL